MAGGPSQEARALWGIKVSPFPCRGSLVHLHALTSLCLQSSPEALLFTQEEEAPGRSCGLGMGEVGQRSPSCLVVELEPASPPQIQTACFTFLPSSAGGGTQLGF